MKLSVFALVFLVSACAENRYLTKEQDAQIKEACEAQGCVMVPVPVWQKIQEIFGQFRGAI
jgi:hypothetical protein